MITLCEKNRTHQSQQYFERAQHYIPGGVNSPVRSFRAVEGIPRFIKSAKKAFLTDVDDNRYIDYVGSFGPAILGHAHPSVVKSIQETVEKGLCFGAPCEGELILAEKICRYYPSIQKIRMVNSGTEAVMSAIRLARGFTQRGKIIKFEGCYHGHVDSLLVTAGSGNLTLGIERSEGVTLSSTQDTLIAHYNHLDSVIQLFEQHPHSIAAVIVEPIACNMNTVLPDQDFLPGLRKICDEYGALLIFDEIITGFRVALGGAQQKYSVCPDLTTLGKIIGGGLPIGAFGGREEIMNLLAPLGPVYQAGTLSGNPVTMAAGIATLNELDSPHFYEELERKTQYLARGFDDRACEVKIPMMVNHSCGIFGIFFTDEPLVRSYSHVKACHKERFNLFFHGMLNKNIYFAPSAFEAGFISSAHDYEILDETLKVFEEVLITLK